MPCQSVGIEEIGAGFFDETGCHKMVEQPSFMIYVCQLEYLTLAEEKNQKKYLSLTKQCLFGSRLSCQLDTAHSFDRLIRDMVW